VLPGVEACSIPSTLSPLPHPPDTLFVRDEDKIVIVTIDGSSERASQPSPVAWPSA